MNDKIVHRIRELSGGELQPVQPWRSPWQRAVISLPVWILLLVIAAFGFGLRPDAPVLGFFGIWIVSGLQWTAAYAVLLVMLRNLVPGSYSPSLLVAGVAVGGTVVHLALSFLTRQLSLIPVPEGEEIRLWAACFSLIFSLALVPLCITGWLWRGGLPSSYVILAGLGGLAAGLSAESAWRTHCPYSGWEHIVSAHDGAIVLSMIAGVLSVILIQRRGSSES